MLCYIFSIPGYAPKKYRGPNLAYGSTVASTATNKAKQANTATHFMMTFKE